MTKNINANEELDDTEGHGGGPVSQDAVAGFTGALNRPTAPKAVEDDDDTEGHRRVMM